MLIGGALAWFNTRSTSDFYNAAREFESIVRSVQSEGQSNLVPGSLGQCTTANQPNCPIKTGEEVFGTAVGVSPSATDQTQQQIQVYSLKRGPEINNAQAEAIYQYSQASRDVPGAIRVEGIKIFVPSSIGCETSTESYGQYFEEGNNPTGTVEYKANQTDAWSVVTFRRVSNSFNAFYNSSGGPIYGTDIFNNNNVFPTSKPTGSGSSTNAGWRGSYDDPTYRYQSPPTGAAVAAPLSSKPCAVMWRLGSIERAAGSPSIGVPGTKPRFTAELVFDVKNGITRLFTR